MAKTIRDTVDLSAATKESLAVTIECDRDPTDTAPAFGLSAKGAAAPSSWVNGAWLGTWSNETHEAVAVTPMLGQAIPLTVGVYDVWIKVTVGGETPVWKIGSLDVA